MIIRGTVRGDNNQPVAGASVLIKGSQTGTATNQQGEFSINAPGNATLIITALEYETSEIMINNRSVISITLKQAEKSLGEVVVIGYGTQKKKDITGSVARVNLETMKNSPNTNLWQLLQGTVPGLNVGVSTVAGGTPSISIRGQVTLNGNTSVLIILDGIQYNGSLSSINPDDIASIDILKDTSATAVYGAQAANGVILITSRKGQAGQKPRIAYSGSYASQRPTVNLRPLNRDEYLQRVTDAFWRQAYLAPDYTTPNPAFNLVSKVDASMRDASGNLLQNAAELFLLQAIVLNYFPTLTNPVEGKKHAERVHKEICTDLEKNGMKPNKSNNRHIIQFIKQRAPKAVSFLV